MRPQHRCADRQTAAEDHLPTTSLSSLLSQDFLKYSKKASLDTSELEVSCVLLFPCKPPASPLPAWGLVLVWGSHHGGWSLCALSGEKLRLEV